MNSRETQKQETSTFWDIKDDLLIIYLDRMLRDMNDKKQLEQPLEQPKKWFRERVMNLISWKN